MLSGNIIAHGQRSPQEMGLYCTKRLLIWSSLLMVLLRISCWGESGYPQNMNAILAWGVMWLIHVWLPLKVLCRNWIPWVALHVQFVVEVPYSELCDCLWGSSAPSTQLFSNPVGCGQCCMHFPVKCLVLSNVSIIFLPSWMRRTHIVICSGCAWLLVTACHPHLPCRYWKHCTISTPLSMT
jgi:hypothetical protein